MSVDPQAATAPIALDPSHLRAVARAATPGHWVPEPHAQPHNRDAGRVTTAHGDYAEVDNEIAATVEHRDAVFIATFDPETVLALLDLAFGAERQRR